MQPPFRHTPAHSVLPGGLGRRLARLGYGSCALTPTTRSGGPLCRGLSLRLRGQCQVL
jgi:hypothetical protein